MASKNKRGTKMDRDWTQRNPQPAQPGLEPDAAEDELLGLGEFVLESSKGGAPGRISWNENTAKIRKSLLAPKEGAAVRISWNENTARIRNSLLGPSRTTTENDDVQTSSNSSVDRGNKQAGRKNTLTTGENFLTRFEGSRYIESTFDNLDLESWWINSALFTRLNVVMLVVLFTFGILYLIAGAWVISKYFRDPVKTPYVCRTHECYKASHWLTSAMNLSVDPCDNFYEFMCGNYHNHHNHDSNTTNTREGELLQELVLDPAFKVEFGDNSIWAKMLHNFKKDPVADQSIKYYQACLNEQTRKDFGFEAFVDTVESIFGTRNFSNFESTNLSMEEIGANVLTYTGDATYINVAYHVYPYIAYIRPSKKMGLISSHSNENLVERVFKKLLPLLGVHEAEQINDASRGVHLFSSITNNIEATLRPEKTLKKITLESGVRAKYIAQLTSKLYRSCPPMGIRLDIRELIARFTHHHFKLEFYDLMALKFFVGYDICFTENQSKFTEFQTDYPKLAFVAPWLFGIFWDFLSSMDTNELMVEWNISKVDLPHSELVEDVQTELNQHIELRCLLNLGKNMGYLPVMHYLTSTMENPMDQVKAEVDKVRKLYAETGKWFKKIPASEMDPNMEALGRHIFGRDIHVDVIKPLVSGVWDSNPALDWLNFTNDHLGNSFKAIKYTVERARQNWYGSTNTEPTVKWWGSGDTGNSNFDLQDQLFDIRQVLTRSAEIDESLHGPLSKNDAKWEKFLGRPLPNYLFYSLMILDQPYTGETLFLKTGGKSVKIIKSIYSLISDSLSLRYHSFYEDAKWPYAVIDLGRAEENRNRTCSLLDYQSDPKMPYKMRDSIAGAYSWKMHQLYLCVLALKQSFQLLRHTRISLSNETFNWNLKEAKKKLVTQRLLPGKLLKKYNEEQLFFMTYARHACRGNWKTHKDDLFSKRLHLEGTVLHLLTQMEEFANVWKCKKDAIMSNQGQPRCIQWVP